MRCCSCNEDLTYQASFELPCPSKHNQCSHCFSTTMASRSCDFYFSCPCNGMKELSSWKTKTVSKQVQYEIKKPDADEHPLQYHYHHCKSNPEDPFLTKKSYVTFSSVDKKGNFLHTTSEILGDNKADEQSEKEKVKLEQIFAMFNPIIAQASKECYNFEEPLFGSSEMNESETLATERTIFDIARHDQTLLYRCLFALTTGYTISFDESRDSNSSNCRRQDPIILGKRSAKMKNLQSRVFVCADIIRNAKTCEKSALKNHIGNLLLVHGANQAVCKILNKLGISTCKESIRLNVKETTHKKLSSGIPLLKKAYDLFLVLYDNIGFRRKGGGKKLKGVGYDQYTAVTIHRISKETLEDWGIYQGRKEGK